MKKILDIYIDESGDFGPFEEHCRFYIIAVVCDKENVKEKEELTRFEECINQHGFPPGPIHAAPLIRKDTDCYKYLSLDERRKMFASLFALSRKLSFVYIPICVEKSADENELSLSNKLAKELINSLHKQVSFFSGFNHIVIHYDNGQIQLTKIILSVFTSLFSAVEYQQIAPSDSRLFQIADMLCTLELINEKRKRGGMSNSEKRFFGSEREFLRNYYKKIEKRKMQLNTF